MVIKIILRCIVVFLLLLGIGLYSANHYAWNLWNSVSFHTDRMVNIKPGTPASHVYRKMSDAGIIPEADWFYWWFRLHDFGGLRSGEYLWKGSQSPGQIWSSMQRGDIFLHPITILEGWNSYEIYDYLSRQEILNFDLSDRDPVALAQQFDIDEDSIEGWIAPDTYYVERGSSASALITSAVLNMNKWLHNAWLGRDQTVPLNSPYELLILASIVEKETGVAEERPLIASVFVNRTKKGMRLQTDPTVIYGLEPNFNGDITRKDLRTLTPWNTYRIQGLPPTPIASPSLDALLATANPDTSPYFYFVAQGEGKHYFSETLSEHNEAVSRYILESK